MDIMHSSYLLFETHSKQRLMKSTINKTPKFHIRPTYLLRIPLTKGQQCGKHATTSSCKVAPSCEIIDGQVHFEEKQKWVNIGSGNGLMLDGTKPLPEPMLTDHQWGIYGIHLGQFHKKCWRYRSLIWENLKILIQDYSRISEGPVS